MRYVILGMMLLLPTLVMAQSATLEDFMRDLPQNYITHQDSTLPANFDAEGTEITWDLSDLTGGTIDTSRGEQIIAAPYPHTDSFPTATLCTRQMGSDIWTYYREVSGSLFMLGTAEGTDSVSYLVHHPGWLYQFPLEYGSYWTFADSIPQTAMGMTINVGWDIIARGMASGTLITPVGSYNVLAISQSMEATVTYSGFTIPLHRFMVTLFDPAIGDLATWDSMLIDVPGYPTTMVSRAWSEPFTVGVRSNTPKPGPVTISILPQPANSEVTVNLPTLPGDLRIFDLNGRVLRNVNTTGAVRLSLDNLPAGSYPVSWTDGRTIQTSRIVITR